MTTIAIWPENYSKKYVSIAAVYSIFLIGFALCIIGIAKSSIIIILRTLLAETTAAFPRLKQQQQISRN